MILKILNYTLFCNSISLQGPILISLENHACANALTWIFFVWLCPTSPRPFLQIHKTLTSPLSITLMPKTPFPNSQKSFFDKWTWRSWTLPFVVWTYLVSSVLSTLYNVQHTRTEQWNCKKLHSHKFVPTPFSPIRPNCKFSKHSILHYLPALHPKRTQNTHIGSCVTNQPRYNMDNWPPIQLAYRPTQNVQNAARKYLC